MSTCNISAYNFFRPPFSPPHFCHLAISKTNIRTHNRPPPHPSEYSLLIFSQFVLYRRDFFLIFS